MRNVRRAGTSMLTDSPREAGGKIRDRSTNCDTCCCESRPSKRFFFLHSRVVRLLPTGYTRTALCHRETSASKGRTWYYTRLQATSRSGSFCVYFIYSVREVVACTTFFTSFGQGEFSNPSQTSCTAVAIVRPLLLFYLVLHFLKIFFFFFLMVICIQSSISKRESILSHP